MMWALAVIVGAMTLMFGLYVWQDGRRHEREARAWRRKEIEDAKARLEEALRENPDDMALHGALRAELVRLRNEAQ